MLLDRICGCSVGCLICLPVWGGGKLRFYLGKAVGVCSANRRWGRCYWKTNNDDFAWQGRVLDVELPLQCFEDTRWIIFASFKAERCSAKHPATQLRPIPPSSLSFFNAQTASGSLTPNIETLAGCLPVLPIKVRDLRFVRLGWK